MVKLRDVSLVRWSPEPGKPKTVRLGPYSTTSICCGFVGRQVVQHSVQHLDMSGCCGLLVGLRLGTDVCHTTYCGLAV